MTKNHIYEANANVSDSKLNEDNSGNSSLFCGWFKLHMHPIHFGITLYWKARQLMSSRVNFKPPFFIGGVNFNVIGLNRVG